MIKSKEEWISDFREAGASAIVCSGDTIRTNKDKLIAVRRVSNRIKGYREQEIRRIEETARKDIWDNQKLLNEMLMLTYAFNIAMLECRNKIWKYEYMSFARRIGELWEPFCKLVFDFPIKPLTLISPPSFKKVQTIIKRDAAEYIDGLELSNEIKAELKYRYDIPWTMVDSGGIKLGLDLHFEQNGIHYNCDFKSGFSSNEKGNTNRLLLVASIYRFIGENEKTILFVRQPENENSHYLQTLKNSMYWDVYCGEDCYAAIKTYTGFDMRKWLDENVHWQYDICDELRSHLEQNGLLKYLTW